MPEKKPIISGEQDPKLKETTILTKDQLLFKMDENGEAIPEKIPIEVYDKSIDDELFMVTIDLDNAISMHDSIKIAFKNTLTAHNVELDKLRKRVEDLEKLKELTKEQNSLLGKTRKDLKDRTQALDTLALRNETQLQAYRNKIIECRKDWNSLEEMRDKTKKEEFIVAKPCNISDSNRIFVKQMWKEDGKWTNATIEWQKINPDIPITKEIEQDVKTDTRPFIYLCTEYVVEPKLTKEEWENLKNKDYLHSIKDALMRIAGYDKKSPKDVLTEKRRSDNLKNIIGESQEKQNTEK